VRNVPFHRLLLALLAGCLFCGCTATDFMPRFATWQELKERHNQREAIERGEHPPDILDHDQRWIDKNGNRTSAWGDYYP
jgi:hypothetical protein